MVARASLMGPAPPPVRERRKREMMAAIDWNDTVIAHRGNSSEAPENTLAAFDAAVASAQAAGAVPWIELDLQLSADGHVVVIHDDQLERTTNGAGAVADHTLAELHQLDAGSWFAAEFVASRIPSLEQFVEWLTGTAAHVLVEYKGHWRAGEVTPTIAAFERAGVGDRLVLQSFDPRTVHALGQRAGDYPRGLLVDERAHYPGELMVAELLGVSAVNPAWQRVVADPDLVRRVHHLGASVAVWTPDTPEAWRQVRDAGVDAIITNRPAAATSF